METNPIYDVRTISLPLFWGESERICGHIMDYLVYRITIKFSSTVWIHAFKWCDVKETYKYKWIELAKHDGSSIPWEYETAYSDEKLLSIVQEWYWECCNKYKTE